jgi:hypothetical protein
MIKQIDIYKKIRRTWDKNPETKVKKSNKAYKRQREKFNYNDYLEEMYGECS